MKHNTRIRFSAALMMLVVMPGLLYAVGVLFMGWKLAFILPVLLIVVELYGTLYGWRHLVVKKCTCKSLLLPKSFEGYKILQISDLHVGTFLESPSFVEKLVEKINSLSPDLIVFTGDLVNIKATEVVPFVKILKKLKAKDGVYSVLGNHDYCEYGIPADKNFNDFTKKRWAIRNQHALMFLQRQMGWNLLMNENVKITRQNEYNKEESIFVIGVENISKPPFQDYGNMTKAMEGMRIGTFKILLTHDPSHWRRGVIGQTDIALTLSGHTHAGQFKIGKFSPAKWMYHEWGGKYVEEGSMLHVSLGVGGTMPFRLGAWPEINEIKLVRH